MAFPSAIGENAIMLVQFFFVETSMRILMVLFFAVLTIPFTVAQQNESPDTTAESAKQAAAKKGKKEPTPAAAATPNKTAESGKPAEPPKTDANEATDKDKEEHYDVAEVPPVITRHQITLNGKTLHY